MTTLAGQVAIISGGLGDIGRAIALELARRGADVALGDLFEPGQAEALLAELRSLGRRARYDRVDVADAEAVRTWVENADRDLGTPTLIIPNAAIVQLGGFAELTPERWRHELSVNLDGTFHVAQHATRRLVDRGLPGRVVFIGSWAAHAVHAHIPGYCVAKAGLRMLCRCLAAELAPHDILVNEVAPGWVDAGLTARIFDGNPDMRGRALDVIPVRRMIEPEEVAVQVAHLCDPANRHITGTTLLMDGGLSLRLPTAQGTPREPR